ncbi:MAG: hypothetical protein R6W82_09555 [bacterium]
MLETDFTDEPACIYTDPGQFEQIMVNLVVNATEAMPRGGALRIAVEVETEPGEGTAFHVYLPEASG